jgi:hypothetical protein
LREEREREVKLIIIAFIAYILVAAAGCFEQPKQIAAAAGYEAQQMRCIEQYNDKESIDKCRERVKKAWSTDSGTVDASPEAGRTLNIGFDNDGGKQ